MNKITTVIVSILILVLFSAIGLTLANKSEGLGFNLEDKVLKNEPNASKNYNVEKEKEIILKGISISLSEELATDGNFIYLVKDKSKNIIGQFVYTPGQENRPLFFELDNGDIILGKQQIYKASTNTVEPLLNHYYSWINDYDVYDNRMALIGVKDNDMLVVEYNLMNDEITELDSYNYPEFTSMEKIYLSYDNKGNLYYDSVSNEKPAIKYYDFNKKEANVFLENALLPQVSSNGKYMVFVQQDAFYLSEATTSGVVLYNLENKQETQKLKSHKVLWDENYLFTVHLDNLEVFDLMNNAKKIKDFKVNGTPYEIKMNDKKVKIKYTKINDIEKTITNEEVELEIE